ncbi:MAG: hypothetical protein U0414_18765 [Polyangiaceae bacterium]
MSEPASAAVAESPPAPDPRAIDIAVLAAPATFAIDGDPSEWGPLDARPELDREPWGDPEVLMAAAQEERFRSQTPAPSHVAVAVTPEHLYVVGAVGAEAAAGFDLALRFRPVDFPDVNHTVAGSEDSPPCPPDEPGSTFASCMELRREYYAFVASERARYTSILHIDGQAVSASEPRVAAALADAKFVAKRSGASFTFEAELPLAALPRASEAPLRSMALAASVAPLATAPEVRYLPAALEEVEFNPLAGVRRHVVGDNWRSRTPRSVSYQPGDPNAREIIRVDGATHHLISEKGVIFTVLGTDGDDSIGVIDGTLLVAGLHRGSLVSTEQFEEYPRVARLPFSGAGSPDGKYWTVVAPETVPDDRGGVVKYFKTFQLVEGGKLVDVFSSGSQWTPTNLWTKVEATLSKDLTVLKLSGVGYRGMDRSRPLQALEATWIWDPSEWRYALVGAIPYIPDKRTP